MIDSHRTFSVSRDWRECATHRLLLIFFKWISVQDNSIGWGTEGSEGRWVRQACIGQSVILNYQVCRDKTSGGCYIPTHCPQLPTNVTATLSPPIGWMDVVMCGRRGGVCVGAEGRADAHACGLVHLPPVPAHLSHHTTPSVVRLTGAGAQTDVRAGGRVLGGACRSPAFDCAQRQHCCSSSSTTNNSML